MHVSDLLHAQPAELAGADTAVHAVAAAVVGLHDVGATAGACLYFLHICKEPHTVCCVSMTAATSGQCLRLSTGACRRRSPGTGTDSLHDNRQEIGEN